MRRSDIFLAALRGAVVPLDYWKLPTRGLLAMLQTLQIFQNQPPKWQNGDISAPQTSCAVYPIAIPFYLVSVDVIGYVIYSWQSEPHYQHQNFAERRYSTLRDMGFSQSRTEDDIWMRCNGDVYEYMAIYVDDICIVAKDPEKIIKIYSTA